MHAFIKTKNKTKQNTITQKKQRSKTTIEKAGEIN